MRERQQLEASLTAFDRLIRGLDDNIELLALGEEEGDDHVVAEAEKALFRLRQEAHTREVEALLSGEADNVPMSRSMRAPAAPKARIGRRC